MPAWLAGGQELGLTNGFRREDADVTEADSVTGIVAPLASLPSSGGLKGLIGVVGLLTDLLCVVTIGELGLENGVELKVGEDTDKHSSCSSKLQFHYMSYTYIKIK